MPCERKHLEAIEEARGIVSGCRNGRIAWPLRLRVTNLLDKALSACDESPWRSMESAPKDGTRIIVSGEHGPVWCNVYWKKMVRVPDRWESYIGVVPFSPSYWMPLPAAPEVGKP